MSGILVNMGKLTDDVADFVRRSDVEVPKCLGLQMTMEVHHDERYAPLLKRCMNNLGEPFGGDTRSFIHSFPQERELVRMSLDIQGVHPDSGWGYVTAGSSISNLHAIYNARRVLATCPNLALLCPRDVHYSVTKCADVCNVKCRLVDVDQQGHMQLESIWEQCEGLDGVIVVVSNGGVRTGITDDVSAIADLLQSRGIKYYIHLDGALGGWVLPFLDRDAPCNADVPDYYWETRLSHPDISSMSISIYKHLGLAMPASLFLTKRSVLAKLPCARFESCAVVYDQTIEGSRNGYAAFTAYAELKRLLPNMMQRTTDCIQMADYLIRQLNSRIAQGAHWAGVRKATRPPGMMCVTLQTPPTRSLCEQFHLPMFTDDRGEWSAHIFTMSHVTKDMLDAFVESWDAELRETAALADIPSSIGATVAQAMPASGLPRAGFGTHRLTHEQILEVLPQAAEAGFRLFATASMYKNLGAVGEALRSTGIPRSQLFIAHKIYVKKADQVSQFLSKDLAALGLDYVDALMLHFPVSHEQALDVWSACENEQKAGRARVLGVSNHSPEQLARLANCEKVPVVHEVSGQNLDAIAATEAMGCDVMLYGVANDSNRVMANPNHCVLSQSRNPARMRSNYMLCENRTIFDATKQEVEKPADVAPLMMFHQYGEAPTPGARLHW